MTKIRNANISGNGQKTRRYRKWLLPRSGITKIQNVNCSGCIGYAGPTKFGHCGSPRIPDSSSSDDPSVSFNAIINAIHNTPPTNDSHLNQQRWPRTLFAGLFAAMIALIMLITAMACGEAPYVEEEDIEPSKPATGEQNPGTGNTGGSGNQGTGNQGNQNQGNQQGGSSFRRPTEPCNLTMAECYEQNGEKDTMEKINRESRARCREEGCGNVWAAAHNSDVLAAATGAVTRYFYKNDGVYHYEDPWPTRPMTCGAYVDWDYILEVAREQIDERHSDSRSLQPIAAHVHMDGEKELQP